VSAVKQLYLLYGGRIPWQHNWVIVSGLLIGLALLFQALSGAGSPAIYGAGLVPIFGPVVLLMGVLCRSLSAVRVHRLVPHFRLKMLFSVALLLFTLSLLGATISQFVPISIEISFVQAVACTLLALSILFAATFLLSGSYVRMLVAIPVAHAFLIWLFADGLSISMLEEPGISTAATTIMLGLWILFAALYLLTPRILPVAWQSAPDSAVSRERPTVPADQAIKDPVNLYVFGRNEWPWEERLVTVCAVLLALPAVFWLLSKVITSGLHHSVFVTAPLIFVMLTPMVPKRIAQRMRSLWLKVGLSRADLFRLAESSALRSFRWTALLAFGLVVALALVFPEFPPLAFAQVLGICIATGLCLTYWGLMHIQGSKWLDAGVLIGLALSNLIAIGAIIDNSTNPIVVAAIVLVQALGSVLCRGIATRRWTTIDWVAMRPAPTAARHRVGA
jgi:hypothetical protein